MARQGAEAFARLVNYVEAFLTEGDKDQATTTSTRTSGNKEVSETHSTFRSTSWKGR